VRWSDFSRRAAESGIALPHLPMRRAALFPSPLDNEKFRAAAGIRTFDRVERAVRRNAPPWQTGRMTLYFVDI
jgi:hypothetical protein